MNRVITFLKEVRVELSKVSWPSRNQTIKYTLIVFGLSASMAIFLGFLDFIFETSLNKFLSR